MSNAAEVVAAIKVAAAVGEAIKDLGEVPNGHLYANLMGHMDLDTYNKCIGILKQANLVEESNHVLRWVGPS